MTPKPTGTLCWADLLPTDQARAIEFYGALAGWTAAVGGEQFGGYALAFGGGEQEGGTGQTAMVGGLNPSIATVEAFRERAGEAPTPMEPGWTAYLATADLDATVQAVLDAGGQLLKPRMDIPTMGASALCADPAGMPFGLWQAAGHDGFGAYGEPGAFCWGEIYSTDVVASRDFFCTVFGLQWRALSETETFTYYQLALPGQEEQAFGVMRQPETLAGQPSSLGLYLFISDVDTAVQRVTDHGGTVVTAPFDSPFGRMATLTDSEGAAINIVDPATAKG